MTATDTAPQDSTGRHYAALDGLRGVAVLLVFCVHAAGNAAAVVFDADFDRVPFRVARDDRASACCSGCTRRTTAFSCSSCCPDS